MVHITEGTCADVTFLDNLILEPGAIYIMDRGYLDFERLHRFTDAAAFFVTRTKQGIRFRRRTSHPVDVAIGLVSDHTVGLATATARRDYPDQLRRVRYVDPTTTKRLTFLTNNFTLPALTIAHLYKARWQVELFFKWIKQHLRIKAFYGTSENAVKTQIWIALSVYSPRGHCQAASRPRRQPLQTSADSERHAFRKNAHFYYRFRCRLPTRRDRRR